MGEFLLRCLSRGALAGQRLTTVRAQRVACFRRSRIRLLSRGHGSLFDRRRRRRSLAAGCADRRVVCAFASLGGHSLGGNLVDLDLGCFIVGCLHQILCSGGGG